MDAIDTIRDKFITGTFGISHDGRKEPTDWKEYAKLLEGELSKKVVVNISEIWTEIMSCVIDASVNKTCSIPQAITNIVNMLHVELTDEQKENLHQEYLYHKKRAGKNVKYEEYPR